MRLVAARPAAAEMIAGALSDGGRRIVFREHRAFAGPEGIMPVVVARAVRTLLLTEFSLIRPTVAELRGLTSKAEVGEWGSDARIVVANYERAGLYLRFVNPSDFRLLAMMEHGPENERSAAAIVAHLDPDTVVQVVRTRAASAVEPDVTLLRGEDGRIERRDRVEAAASAA